MSDRKEQIKKVIPPYLPYRTFINFLDGIRVNLPSIIDRSIMPSMSGVYQSQLIYTLEYLGLINPGTGAPTDKLANVVHSEGADKQRILKEIVASAYTFLFKDGFDLKRTTFKQLSDQFEKTGAKGDTVRKCIAFFIKATEDAGLELSPYIKKSRGPRPGATRSRRKPTITQIKESPFPGTGKDEPSSGEEMSLDKLLLSKFPSFDPAWPDEVKAKWFDGFKELMAQFKKDNE